MKLTKNNVSAKCCLFIEAKKTIPRMYYYFIDIDKLKDGYNDINEVLVGDKDNESKRSR